MGKKTQNDDLYSALSVIARVASSAVLTSTSKESNMDSRMCSKCWDLANDECSNKTKVPYNKDIRALATKLNTSSEINILDKVMKTKNKFIAKVLSVNRKQLKFNVLIIKKSKKLLIN
jgi:hypothetical protein